MRSENNLKTGVILSYVNLLLGNIIPLVYTPIMLKMMGQNEYGLYTLSSSFISYLSLLNFGIGSAIIRYLTKYRVQKDKQGEENMFGLFTIIFCIISGIVIVGGIVLSHLAPVFYSESLSGAELEKMQILVVMMSVNTAISFSYSTFTSVILTHERYIANQAFNILSTVAMPCLNLVMLYMGFQSIGLVMSSTCINILLFILNVGYCLKKLQVRPRYNNLPVHLLKDIFKFSFWVFVANITGLLFNSTDKVIIGAVPSLGTAAVAVYNIGATFNDIVYKLTVNISSLLSPKLNAMVCENRSNKELTDVVIRVGRLQSYLVFLVISGFIVFGKQFIQIWAGRGYEDSYWVALLMMIPASVPLIEGTALSIIMAQNRHRFRSIVYSGIAVLNVATTIVLVRYFGIIGAAFTTGMSNVIGQGLVMNWYYYKKIGLEMPCFWRNIGSLLPIPVCMCIIGVILDRYIDYSVIPVFLTGVIVYTIIFAGLSWKFCMNEYEKDLIRIPVKKLMKKSLKLFR